MPVAYDYIKTTKTFHLYKYRVGALYSELFIHQWRVPENIPGSIGVEILYEDEFIEPNKGGYYFYKDNPLIRYQDIVWSVRKNQTNTYTIRYEAEGYSNRPFHTIYIPYGIYLAERAVPSRLQAKIVWL